MKRLILNIKDNRTALFLEALIDIVPSIEIEGAAKKAKSKLLEEIKEAVEEIKEIKAGKKKGKPFKDLLNEL